MAHSHCDSCISAKCRSTENGCPVEICPNGCETFLHRCKVDEHTLYTCMAAKSPCINAPYGCEEVLPRAKLASHLEHCPASVLFCRFSYDRSATNSSHIGHSSSSASPQTTHPHDQDSDEADKDKELLLDEKLLQSDVALARQENKYVKYEFGVEVPSHEIAPVKLHDFDLHCNTGSMTHATRGSVLHNKLVTPRSRLCIDTTVKHHDRYSNPSTVQRHYFCFPCNEIVRRDEFSVHWKDYHLDVQVNMCHIIERCPARTYGCKHAEVRMTPNPEGASLDYNKEADCVGLKLLSGLVGEPDSPSASGTYVHQIQKQQELAHYGYGEDDESYDVLSQLPVEILMNICMSLDSLGLWNLSQVNHYIRDVCYNLVKKRGIVYYAWCKNDDVQSWQQGQKVYCVLALYVYTCFNER